MPLINGHHPMVNDLLIVYHWSVNLGGAMGNHFSTAGSHTVVDEEGVEDAVYREQNCMGKIHSVPLATIKDYFVDHRDEVNHDKFLLKSKVYHALDGL